MLLIFAINILFIITGLMKLLFSNSEQIVRNPVYKSIEWKIKNLSEALAHVEELNVSNQTQLDEQLKQSRANTYRLKNEVDTLLNQKKSYSGLMDSITVVKFLQARMDSMGLNQGTLGIVHPDETTTRKNKSLLDPMTSTQRRNLFLAISDSKNYRLICKFDEITAIQTDEIIDFLKSPKLKGKPATVITIEEFESTRKKKMQDIIQKRKLGIRTSQSEPEKGSHNNDEQDYLKLLQIYDSEERELIRKYRDALNHLSQFGIDDIGMVEEKYNDILEALEQKEQELKKLDKRCKQLSQIKSAIAFADNKNYLYGPFREILKIEHLQEKIEIVEASEEHNCLRIPVEMIVFYIKITIYQSNHISHTF